MPRLHFLIDTAWSGPAIPSTHDTSDFDRDRNNQAACGAFIPNPPGPDGDPDSCDEYPFQSTYQGAFFVGPGRFSTEHVPNSQNSQAGSLLGGFYLRNRIIDGDPFYAWIVS
jgi:Deoxyribonuclease NucA/NucB